MTAGGASGSPPCGMDAGAAGALHDFNNALQALSASLRHLERRIVRGDLTGVAAMIPAITDQAVRIGALGAALARASTGDARADHPPLAVSPFIRAMAQQAVALLDGSVRLELLLDADAGHVACDPARLESAIRNLMLNARDAMPDGGVLALRGCVVDLGRDPEPDGVAVPPGRFAAITVADTGYGMDADMLRRCFEPFVSTKTTRGGHGLGLFQLRAFAVEAGGTVRLRSRQGLGTEATILLPCAAPLP